MQIFRILQPRTLQQRNTLYILLPTFIVLLLMAIVSLMLVRQVLLNQWEETAIAKMQRAAFEVDQHLMRPKRVLMLYQEHAGQEFNRQVSRFLLGRLRDMEGVVQVNFEWDDVDEPIIVNSEVVHRGGNRSMQYSRMRTLEVTAPQYDADLKGETVSLVSEFHDQDNNKIGQLVVKISFYDLIDKIVKTPWWKTNRAFLVDQSGNVLARTELFEDTYAADSPRVFGTGSNLEKKTLAELQQRASGTVFGEGMPPDEVSGYYRLKEAPWTMVLIAPGDVALQPVLMFRKYYFLTGGIGIILALLLIRVTTSTTAHAIIRVTEAARSLAKGEFGEPLMERGQDEVAELTKNFNIMTRQLKERMHLQEAMGIAREVQQNLLPESSYRLEGLDISGKSLYCQETGGDYYDILPDKNDRCRVDIVLGDVVGHGIGAALLMASIRAFIRCRTALPGSPAEVINDVNELLCKDTERSGNFVTLFYMVLDRDKHKVHWVRCGHDPAIVYNVADKSFSELRGEGLVLGFDSEWKFRESSISLHEESIILIGSDGAWETENENGDQFGKERLKQLIAQHCTKSSQEIITAITEEVTKFRGKQPQSDDITLVVVKATNSKHRA